ncbi:hypothetical protein GCM10027589_40100 [Actinocorallia lasiicapitis]
MTPLLSVRGLRKTYGPVIAVAGISFDVPEGGSLGIVGESGSGKTTTARMLVGLERPDAGTILLNGAPLPKHRLARATSVQMVFQDPYQSLDSRIPIGVALTGLLKLHRSTTDPKTLLDQVGLGDREAGSLPRQLSGGQRQRAAIALALAVTPRILVLDEAVSALDVSVQAQVLNLLTDVRAQTGITLIFVSHDLAVVRYLCDEALVMHHGEVVETGPVESLLTTPQADYTRRLLAAVPRAHR